MRFQDTLKLFFVMDKTAFFVDGFVEAAEQGKSRFPGDKSRFASLHEWLTYKGMTLSDTTCRNISFTNTIRKTQ